MSEADPPIFVARFTCQSGEVIERSWYMGDDLPAWMNAPPEWLDNPLRKWPRPWGPISVTGDVRPGFEQHARDLVG